MCAECHVCLLKKKEKTGRSTTAICNFPSISEAIMADEGRKMKMNSSGITP